MTNNSEKIRVLHIPTWYPSEKNPVLGLFVHEHVKATALFADVVVLYNEGWDNSIRGLYQIKEQVEDGIRTLRVRYRRRPISKISYFLYLWSIFVAFKKLLKGGWKPDLIHAHVYRAGVPAVLLGKKYNLPVIVTEHYTGFPRGLIKGLERWKAKFAFENATLVCPVSEDLAKHIKKLGIKARFNIVPNVVDLNLFYPPKEIEEHEEKRLLTVAFLTPKKGIPYLLQALAMLKEKRGDFVLDIVGDGPNRKEYEEMTKKLGLEDKVFFHGIKPKVEVAKFMRRADIFVLPSLVETFGVVVIEAMACGKPVIATNIGGPNEIINEETGILVPSGNAEALKDAIDFMLDHYVSYNAQRISNYVTQRYSPEKVGKEFYSLYTSALRGFREWE